MHDRQCYRQQEEEGRRRYSDHLWAKRLLLLLGVLMHHKQRDWSPGFSIVEVMVALVIIATVGMGIGSLVENKLNDQLVTRLQVAKARIVKQLEEAVNDPNNIRTSALFTANINNLMINRCGSPTNICPAQFTNPATMRLMDFYAPDAKGGFVRMTGLWSADGLPQCLPNAVTPCPFDVAVYYWFSCPLDRTTGAQPPTCMAPPHMNLVFQIRPGVMGNLPVAQGKGSMNFYYPGTSAAIASPQSVAFTLNAQDIFTNQQSCPPGQYVGGFDNSGRVVCNCNNHSPKRNPDGTVALDNLQHPICLDLNCANQPGTRLGGFSNDPATGDWKPVCIPTGKNNPPICYSIDVATVRSCATGFYLTTMNLGACSIDINAGKKKGTFDPGSIVCGANSGSCCQGNY